MERKKKEKNDWLTEAACSINIQNLIRKKDREKVQIKYLYR